jgi:hypothetical protein
VEFHVHVAHIISSPEKLAPLCFAMSPTVCASRRFHSLMNLRGAVNTGLSHSGCARARRRPTTFGGPPVPCRTRRSGAISGLRARRPGARRRAAWCCSSAVANLYTFYVSRDCIYGIDLEESRFHETTSAHPRPVDTRHLVQRVEELAVVRRCDLEQRARRDTPAQYRSPRSSSLRHAPTAHP